MDDDVLLSLASFDQIFEELSKRHSGLVVIREQPGKDATDESHNFAFSYHGGRSTAVGMIVRAKSALLHDDQR